MAGKWDGKAVWNLGIFADVATEREKRLQRLKDDDAWGLKETMMEIHFKEFINQAEYSAWDAPSRRLREGVTDLRTDGRTDGRTYPLKEMRRRI